MIKMILTINIRSKEGKYFLDQILPKCKHMVDILPNPNLKGPYIDYKMDIEDYYMCRDLLDKIES